MHPFRKNLGINLIILTLIAALFLVIFYEYIQGFYQQQFAAGVYNDCVALGRNPAECYSAVFSPCKP